MRQSRYVVEAIGQSGEDLLYSTSTGVFVQLGAQARQVWNAFGETGTTDARECGANTLSSLASDQQDIVAELMRLGLLTDMSAEEELEAQQRAFDAVRDDRSQLGLSIVPTYACNFRCPYCYEQGHNKVKGKMDARMIDVICDFVARKHADDGFSRLSVQWYGGDPSLVLDVVEELSVRLIAWCEQKSVSYDAMMLTNANVIDEPAADLIARCRITNVYLTIDGPEDIHNKRRVAANGTNSYQRTLEAAHLLQDRGIGLMATMNIDKVNMPYYSDLRHRLLSEFGIVLSAAKLNDYGHFFGEAPFCLPDFDLYTHEEFFEAQLAAFNEERHVAAELREMLRPAERFCMGQLENYFIIDLLGDVYRCDGRVGEKAHVRFNLLDDEHAWRLNDITFDATRDEKCSACALLPICQGSCLWERELSGMPCHPLKTTMGDYLAIYRACLPEADMTRSVTVLAEAFA